LIIRVLKFYKAKGRQRIRSRRLLWRKMRVLRNDFKLIKDGVW
jgi:hypothetical protein